MNKIKIKKYLGDCVFESAKDTYNSGNQDIAFGLSHIAYGFYRDVEDLEGINNCKKYFGERMNLQFEKKAFESARKFYSKLQDSGLLDIISFLLSDEKSKQLGIDSLKEGLIEGIKKDYDLPDY